MERLKNGKYKCFVIPTERLSPTKFDIKRPTDDQDAEPTVVVADIEGREAADKKCKELNGE